jgi:HK97 family phage major capsid protein
MNKIVISKASREELLEARSAYMAQLTGMQERQLTPEEQAAFDALVAQVNEIDAKVTTLEAELMADPAADPGDAAVQQASARSIPALNELPKPPAASEPVYVNTPVPNIVRDLNDRRANRNRDMALRGWALQPTGLCTADHVRAANEIGFNLNNKVLNLRLNEIPGKEIRAQSTSGSAGGYLIPTDLIRSLETALLYTCPIRQFAQVLRTASGNPIDIPTVDDTSNNGELVAENASYATQDVTFSKVTLNAYKFTSKLVLASLELLQDSAINVGEILGNLLGERIGRSQLGYFTTGTGSSQPQGAVTGSAAGVTSASATAIAVDDLLGLVHSVDRAYRDAGAWMMHDSILLAVRKLKDSTNQPIFTQSYIVGEPDRLFGYPVVINNSMASTVATTNKTVLFGDWSKFIIRDALDIQLVRSDERYMEYGQSAFVALARSDSKVSMSGALKRLTQA